MASSRNSPSPDVSLSDRVAAQLAAAGVAPGEHLCLALSGGVDSAVLLAVLAGLRGPGAFRLSAAHVHHGLSPHADAWAAFCAGRCAALDVPFRLFRVAVERAAPCGLEAAARAARHAALCEVACDWLVFAHHQDDQAETLLFRLVRGTGVHGARGMAAVERGVPPVPGGAPARGRLRPLLGVRRAQILAHARAHALEWVEDESNADPRYARNYLRQRVLPALEGLAPAAVPALARAAEHFAEADGLLDELAAQDAAACGGATLWRHAALCALSDARLRNLLRWRVRGMGGEAPSRARLEEALRQLRTVADGHPLRLSLGRMACCLYRGAVWLEAEVPPRPPLPCVWRGEAALAWGGGWVRFEPALGQGLDRARLLAATVELGTRSSALALRPAPGRPRRSFKNLVQEAGIPAWLRARLPVLRVDGEVAWIGGIGCDTAFACPPGGEGVLPVWQP